MRLAKHLMSTLILLASACVVRNGTEPTKTTLYVFADFANPNVTVRVNGQALGQLSHQYTGATDCASLSHVVTSGTMLHFDVQLAQTYEIAWAYGDGRTDADNLSATSEVVAEPCVFEPVPAPASIARP